MDKEQLLKNAYQSGRNANACGMLSHECPYDDAALRKEWFRGWNDGNADRMSRPNQRY